jgi:hypothetical protein
MNVGPFNFGLLNPMPYLQGVAGDWNSGFEQVGANAYKNWLGNDPSQQIAIASQKAGLSPQAQAGMLQGIDYGNFGATNTSQPVPVNQMATQAQAKGILGATQQTQPQGDWLSQLGGTLQNIGGYFQDRPAFTQGLLTAGIAAGAGAPAWMIGATGGQAMKEKQNQMAGMYQAQFERGIQERKQTTDELKAEAEMISAKAGMMNKDDFGSNLELANKMGFKNPEDAYKWAMIKTATGVASPVGSTRSGILGPASWWGKEQAKLNF